MGMSYFTRDDLPYYYALSEAVTIGDQYHQSTFTQTNPNRLHLFSGSNGLSVGQKPFMDNSEPNPGHTWTTVGEVLENANISWRVYQLVEGLECITGLW
jgi:phospholipase C